MEKADLLSQMVAIISETLIETKSMAKESTSGQTVSNTMETGLKIDTEPWKIRDSYIKKIEGLQDFYKIRCGKNLIDYIPIFTDQSLDLCLTEYVNKRKKLG
jgi:hypothetical protein